MKQLGVLVAAAVVGMATGIPATTALAADTIMIGFTVSETGALNVDSTGQINGFNLWREQVNAAGGIKVGGKFYQVAFKTYDDQSKSDRVQQLYSRLILQDNADFLFSPYSSGLTATAAVISEQYGKVMITTGAAEDKTYQLGNKYLFQMYTPASHYLTGALDALKARNPAAKLAVAYADDGFSKAVVSAARVYAKSIGIEVVFDEAYAKGTTDFSPIINKIITSKADALVGGGHYADGATLARQLYDQKAPVKFMSLLVAPDSPKFADMGEAALHVAVPSQWQPQATYKPVFGPDSAAFTKAYKDKYGVEPSYHAAGGYAAGLLLQHAVEQAGTIDTEKVTTALNATDAMLFFGHIKFATESERHGLQIGHEMVQAQWQKKGEALIKEVVWPREGQTADFAYPIR
ncbi:branched-chain amino acid transport system substrate-binding protein [uncultured Gammaproteobacteria bacterium]